MSATNYAALSADVRNYLSKKLLDLIEYQTIFKQFAYVEAIPAGNGKSISFTQYSSLTPPSGVLTDGTTPSDTALVSTAITATVDQVGQFVTLTDMAELTVAHPVMEQTMKLLSQSAARAYDNRIQAVVVAGTSVIYANNKASRILTGATDVVTTLEFQKAAALLNKNGAETMDGGNYAMVVDPSVEMDILNDTKFTNAAAYSQVQRVNEAEVGTWYGIKVYRSNNVPVITGAGASSADIHTSFVFGRNAYAVTDLQNLSVYVEGPGGQTDPLHQRRTVGFKFSNKAVILNQNWMVRIESGSGF